MPEPSRLIFLTALAFDGSESLFDGAPVLAGTHLRWAFLPEVGFPSGGFRVERRFLLSEFHAPTSEWEHVATLKSPLDLAITPAGRESAILDGLRTGLGTAFAEYHRADVASLVQLLHQLHSQPTPSEAVTESGGRSRTRLRVLDLLLMASLDPYIARLLSLYYVDCSALPGTPVDYRVTGLWRAQEWPKHTVRFDEVTPHSVSAGMFQLEQVEFFVGLQARLYRGESAHPLLRLIGGSGTPVQLAFKQPVQEVELEFAESPTTEWIASAAIGNRLIAWTEVDIRGTALRVTGAESFDQLALSPATWGERRLASVSYRRRSGLIGDDVDSATSLVVRVNPIAGRPISAPDLTMPSSPAVEVPVLETLRRAASPAMLTDDGDIVAGTSEVEVVCRAPTIRADTLDIARSVRMHVGYDRVDGPLPRSTDVLTLNPPLPWPTPRLIAFWRLNGDLRAVNRDIRGTLSGSARFVNVRPGVALMDRQHPMLELSIGPARPGAFQVSGLTELTGLGTHLYLQLWVCPDEENIETPTLIGNNLNESFWFGLAKQRGGFRLRFALNGQEPVLSRGTIMTGVWSQVAVNYDGEQTTFFINGRLDGSVPTALGRVQGNSRGRLYIGADLRDLVAAPGPVPVLPYFDPFRGYLADVQIWGATYPLPSRGHRKFLAGWSFDNDVIEARSGTKADTIGRVRFERDHPQHAERHVLLLEGGGYLQAPDRSDLCDPGRRITFQAWINPQEGQKVATVIGNGRSLSYWFGLTAHGDGYRLSIIINGAAAHDSDGLVSAGKWSFVTVSVDGERVIFYINGKQAGVREARFGRFRPNPTNTLCIGADAGSQPRNMLDAFRGKLADVHIWASTPAAPAAALLADKIRTRELQLADANTASTQTERRSGQASSTDYANLRAAWAFEGSVRESKTCRYAQNVGTLAYEKGHPKDDEREVLVLNGSTCVEVRDRPLDFYGYGNQLLLQASINPDAAPLVIDPREAVRQEMALISNDRETSFAFGLRPVGLEYRLWFFINGREFQSSTRVPAQRWSHVGVSYKAPSDAETAKVLFYINGKPDSEFGQNAPLALIGTNHQRVLRIGGEVDADALRVNFAYRGRIADVEIWTTTPEAAATPLPSAAGLPVPADYIARQMPSGDHTFWVSGIDIFGRVGPRSSAAISLNNQASPPAPGGTRAAFIPLRGRIDSVTVPAAGLPGALKIGGVELSGFASGDTPDRTAASLNGLLRHDAQVIRPRRWEAGYADAVPFNINSVPAIEHESEQTLLVFSVAAGPFAQLQPQDQGNEVIIEYDLRFRVSWTWTGTQRLFEPAANQFKTYYRHAIRVAAPHDAGTPTPMDASRLRPETVEVFIPSPPLNWDSFEGEDAVVTIVDDVVAQERPANVLSLLRVDHNEWQGLTERAPAEGGPVKWLPEPERPLSGDPSAVPDKSRKPNARLYKVTLTTRDVLQDAPRRTPPHQMNVEDFVPGALVAYNAARDANSWQHFPVLWHQWIDGTGWVLYIVQNQPGRHRVEGELEPDTPAPFEPRLTFGCYYPGQRYHTEVSLKTPPNFNPLHDGAVKPIGTVRYEISVTTRDDKDRESEKGIAASVVAVNRQRPPLPEKPTVVIGRADYYGNAKAKVRWRVTPELRDADVGYQLYRATDTAIFARDLEQRRQSQDAAYNRRQPGYYSGSSPDLIFADGTDLADTDFVEWLRTCFPKWIRGWERTLFVPKPADFQLPGVSAAEWEGSKSAWNSATPIWRAWSERYYPRLLSSEVRALAERSGNETAFTLLNAHPLDAEHGLKSVMVGEEEHAEYIDSLNGTVRNRYLYRLRSQSPALLQSIGWGPASDPQIAAQLRAPRVPVVTKIEAGDRQITLTWALNREPELREYRVYRARTREEVADLRWWTPNPPDRTLSTIQDPRLKVRGNELLFWRPRGEIAEVVGVYRADEYRASLTPDSQSAFNYFKELVPSSPEPGTGPHVDGRPPVLLPPTLHLHQRISLKRIADGTAVVLVYQDRREGIQVRGVFSDGVSYTDEGLLGLTDYFYRVVAVNGAGSISEASETIRVRAYDDDHPHHPTWNTPVVDASSGTAALSWSADIANLRCLVQRRSPDSTIWGNASSWLQRGEYVYSDNDRPPGSSWFYRLRVMDDSGRVNREFEELNV